MCALNGVASASSACQALSDLLQSIIDTRLEEQLEQLPDATTMPCQTQMLESARDDFVAHSHSYRQLLTAKVTHLVETYCGCPIDAPPTNPSSNPPLHPGVSNARRGLISGGFISMLSAKTPSTSTQSKMNLTPRLPFTTNVTTNALLIPAIQQALHQQPYNITSSADFDRMESEDVLDPAFRQPFRTNPLLTSLGNNQTHNHNTRHCGAEPTVLSEIVRVLTRNLVNVFLTLLLSPSTEGDTNPSPSPCTPTFTDWGSLLLSKQVRILESELCRLIVPSLTNTTQNGSNGDAHKPSSSVTVTSVTMITQQFQKLNQAVTILQLERPIDWLAMRYSDNSTSSHGYGNGNGPDADDGSHRLTKEEIRWLMGRRVDFSPDAIAKVCDQL